MPVSLRVLYLHQYYQTHADYGITRSYEHALYLTGKGHRVTIITGTRSYLSGEKIQAGRGRWISVEESEGIRVIRVEVLFSYRKSFLHRAGAFAVYALLSIWAALISGPADVVFSTSPPLTAGLSGVIISFLKRAPLVFEVRDLWPETIEALGVVTSRLPLALLDAMADVSYWRSHRVLAITPGIARWLVERRGLSPGKVEVVTQGADLDLFPRPDRAAARQALGIGDGYVVLYAGAMGIANGLQTVIQAIAATPGEVHCLLIGEGMEKSRLEALARRVAVDRITFLPGIPRKDIVQYMAAADVGLISLRSLPVFTTALPTKFFDYMAAGLPMIVSFPGDLATAVEQEGIGIYAGDNDPAGIAAALTRLRDDKCLRDQMAGRARHLAETTFNHEHQWHKLERVLLEAVEQGGRVCSQ